jgi:hypothetical protein
VEGGVPQDRLRWQLAFLIISIIAVFAWQIPLCENDTKKLSRLSATVLAEPRGCKFNQEYQVPYADYMLDGLVVKGLFSIFWLHGGLMHIIVTWFLGYSGNSVCAQSATFCIFHYLFVGL